MEPTVPLVIVGPTASGKSALAVGCAKVVVGAEIVSADSMAVYRQMDIGTAKPSKQCQNDTPHHVVDVVEPSQEFGLSEFKTLAGEALSAISQRGGHAIVVGGTGLYVQGLVDDFNMPGTFADVRAELEQVADTESLWRRLHTLDPVAAAKMEPNNRRRVVRALEVTVGSGKPFSSFGPGVDHYPPVKFCQVGLKLERAELYRRTDARFDQQMRDGLLDEVERVKAAGISKTAAQALGYRELLSHLAGEVPLDEAVEQAKQRIRRFARRQESWFKRDLRILWFDATNPVLVEEVSEHWAHFTCQT